MLSPWKNVFDYRSMEALLDKCIAPKLVAGLRKTLVINPSNQVLRKRGGRAGLSVWGLQEQGVSGLSLIHI